MRPLFRVKRSSSRPMEWAFRESASAQTVRKDVMPMSIQGNGGSLAMRVSLNRIARTLILVALALSVVIVASSLVSGCGTEAALSADDQAAIYEQVVRQLCGPDDTFGGQLNPPLAYIITSTDDSSLDSGPMTSTSTKLSESMQEAISERLEDATFSVEWVDSDDVVERNPDGSVANGGVILTLGNLNQRSDGSVTVSGKIYIANLAAGWQTYVVENVDGVWQITGTDGPVQIS